jgi:hypothetical protein
MRIKIRIKIRIDFPSYWSFSYIILYTENTDNKIVSSDVFHTSGNKSSHTYRLSSESHEWVERHDPHCMASQHNLFAFPSCYLILDTRTPTQIFTIHGTGRHTGVPRHAILQSFSKHMHFPRMPRCLNKRHSYHLKFLFKYSWLPILIGFNTSLTKNHNETAGYHLTDT